ncbi:MAG: radical SAM protein [Parachlamydiaceae bacterium]|nr:radical SAM protein [Parachlamydiaceae bacterium]
MNLKTLKNSNDSLNIIEIFSSVQGETSFSGLPTVFVRLAACNLRCTWCDTTYSFGKGTPWTIDNILNDVEKKGQQYVCVTGGEPLLQENVYPFLTSLCDRNLTVTLETGGSLPTSKVDPRVHVILDIKCPKSGMSDKNHWENIERLRSKDEVKFVIVDEEDYNYAKKICAKYNLFSKVKEILFSPVHNSLDPKELVSWILRDSLPVRLNLQIHKYIWDPLTKGV